jgi:thioredoxin 1
MVPFPSVSGSAFASEVLAATTPVLVNFWAPWCGLCRTIEPKIRQLVATAPQPLKLVRINADENLRLAKNYQISALPTLLLFADGQLVYRVESLEEVRHLQEQLPQIFQNLPATGLALAQPTSEPESLAQNF